MRGLAKDRNSSYGISNIRELETILKNQGMSISKSAFEPLKLVDFGRLVDVHDHEEAYLRDHFVRGLRIASTARVRRGQGSAKIRAEDVVSAMLILGAVVEETPETNISSINKTVIKDVCPLCD